MTAALEGAIAFVFLVMIVYGPAQSLVVAFARQQLFVLRDEWFDAAAEGKIRFDDPAYTELRSILNAVIRFAHKVTWLRVAIARRVLATQPPPPVLSTIDNSEVEAFRAQVMKRMVWVLLGAMVLRSPLLVLCSPVVAAFAGLMAIARPLYIVGFPAVFADEVRREASLVKR